jgi:hypothetical protein
MRSLSIACSLFLCVVFAVIADGEAPPIPADPETESPRSRVERPEPELLSGRSWLRSEGLDPSSAERPTVDPMTGFAWSGTAGSAGPSGGAPALQSVGGGFLVPFRSPGPAFSRDLLISRDYSGAPLQTEPHLAVNPLDPEHVVVGMIDYGFPSNTAYVSYDGGESWEGPSQTGYLPDDLISGGDPVMAFDRRGNVYMASISIGIEEFSIGPVFSASEVSSIAVARSGDGGFTWPQITSTFRSKVTISDQQIDPSGRLRGTVNIGFLDKPWMSIGPDPMNRNRDIIYVGFVHFETYYDIVYMGELPLLLPSELATTVLVVSSRDGGVTWSDPVAASPTVRRSYGSVGSGDAPGESSSDRVLQGPRTVIDPNGNLYLAWIDSTDDGSMEGIGEIHVAVSTDGGATFGSSVIASVFNELPFRPRNASFRYWASSFPKMESGPKGELYLVYAARPSEKPMDDGDVYFIRSLDQGKTWSKPIVLNADTGSSLQFFPDLAVSPSGKIHVMWADTRDDPVNLRYHIYYTESDDGGESWGFEIEELGLTEGDSRVSDFGSNPNRGFPNGLFLGDYFGIAATDDEVYLVWPDTRLAEFGGVNQKIAFARTRAIRSPDLFISPSAGSGGEQVTIQGFNFQPDMNVFIQLQDSTIALARTNQDGRFSASVYVPVTGEGAQNILAFDESGNMAMTSFYTEFGFGTINRLFEEVLSELESLRRRIDEGE